jgi:hypothetical protein
VITHLSAGFGWVGLFLRTILQLWFLRGALLAFFCMIFSNPLFAEISYLMNHSPYYGQRRPSMQRGAKLQCVSDLLLLGKATIDEARSLLYWLQNEAGYGKMGICGLSMGM